ncbi:PREDICTED: pectinesterase-like [Ipomoea nil]|uniref:pectinesterase-like n=1 Tax=Ipomoea nil TaxID=35883 RepID=UPI000901C8E6|nr:PREDICTED: pectinesterase-like [Ipomoea nil]
MQNSTPFFLFLLLFLLIFSTAQPGISDPSPSTACKSTLYPKLCHTILSSFRRSLPDSAAYGEFSVNQCINHATTLSATITRFLRRHPMLVSAREVSALDDCAHLAELTVDYLRLAAAELRATDNRRSTTDVMVGRVEALLSAVVTNQQTCHDGLADAGSKIVDALHVPLSNASQLYSVSLGLVSHSLGRRRKVAAGEMGHRPRGMLEAFDWTRNPSFVATKVLESSEREGRMVEELGMGVKVRGMVRVSRDGELGFNFTSIGEAIAHAPNKTKIKDGYFVIYAKEGYYEENVVVGKHKRNIMLIGDGINRTIIVGNRSVADGWTTYKSATFAVHGERFLAIDVTFRNTAGPAKHQAVALRNNADLSAFYRCSFEGYQDTLYTHSLRQFYRDCDVYGTVDFVFGNAAAILQNCNLYARRPLPNQKNVFTAQGRTDPNQNTGISIHNCTVQAAEELNSTSNFLGRPWKVYSRSVFMQSYIGDLIDPAGWLEWDGTTGGLDTVYYGEFENYGGGANTSMRVQWPGYSVMNASQALNFTVYNFTMGDTWLNYTNIPFSQGLL